MPSRLCAFRILILASLLEKSSCRKVVLEIVGVTLEVNDKLSASIAEGGNLEASFWPTVAKKIHDDWFTMVIKDQQIIVISDSANSFAILLSASSLGSFESFVMMDVYVKVILIILPDV